MKTDAGAYRSDPEPDGSRGEYALKTLIIVPAWNEEGNIRNTLADLQAHCPECDVLVINDCSSDGTGKILREDGIPFLDLPVNLGIGGGVQAGYRYALRHGYDAAVQFDGDGQHRAEYIRDLLRPIEQGKADVVIGSRFQNKTGFQSSRMRRTGIEFLSWLIRVLCGVRVLDVTSGMRAVNAEMIALYADHYAQDYPEPEAILQAGLYGARVTEVPVEMRERAEGKSSIGAMRSVYYMIKVSLALVLERMFGVKRK